MLKINLAKSAGFCFGVRRALKIALDTAKSYKKVCMLGDIVHNEDVVKQIEKAGIKKIDRLYRGSRKVLLIRAHGASNKIISAAKKSGYKIIDATCPMVKEIHNIAKRMELKGYKIIILGDRKHDEVSGISGQLKKKALVIQDSKSIPLSKIRKIKKAAVVVQSTQGIGEIKKIINIIKPRIKDFEFFNTICIPTKTKQEEIKKMSLDNDVMVIIGSKISANTKRLYELSKHLNKRSYWVSSGKDLRKKWFNKSDTVGITAGASTPDNTTCSIANKIKKYFH